MSFLLFPCWPLAVFTVLKMILVMAPFFIARIAELPSLTTYSGCGPCLAFGPGGKALAAAGKDGTVKVLALATGRARRALSGPCSALVFIRLSQDGKALLAVHEDGAVVWWDWATGKEIAALRAPAWVGSVALSQDGKTLAVGASEPVQGEEKMAARGVRLYDAKSGKERTSLQGAPDVVSGLAFSPDGKYLAVGGRSSVGLWDTATGRPRITLSADQALAWPVAFSPDGKTLVTGALMNTAQLWDAKTGRMLRSFGEHIHWVEAVAFSSDGKRLATASTTQVKIWEVATGAMLAELWAGRVGGARVQSLAFGPDGKRLACGDVTTPSVLLFRLPPAARGGK
jgi:WD40 repeat protein